MIVDSNGIPRRNRIDLMSNSELAIYKAMVQVEKEGAHLILTDVINLLAQAKEKLSNFIDTRGNHDSTGTTR